MYYFQFNSNLRLVKCKRQKLIKCGGNDEVLTRRPPPLDISYIDASDKKKFQNFIELMIQHKLTEISKAKLICPVQSLMTDVKNAPPVRDFKGAILKNFNKINPIAEVEKASPSLGIIQPDFDPVKISKEHEAGGAACLSVFTDEKFFQGNFDNLKQIRKSGINCPLLCKDFIIDEYQLFLARANGADAVLLLAAVLSKADLRHLLKVSGELGMQCLIKINNVKEFRRVKQIEGFENHLLGVNNPNMQTFKVDFQKLVETEAGLERQWKELVCVGEPPIFTFEDIQSILYRGIASQKR